MKEKETETKSKVLTIAAAVFIIAAALAVVFLYRFTGIFIRKPTEKNIAANLDFDDPQWINRLMEISLPPCEKDFSIYEAFSYSGEDTALTQVYATRAKLESIRSHYIELLENPSIPENNSVGVLELRGTCNGRSVRVVNYFSELSNLIRVDMEMNGEYAGIIRAKIIDSFPSEALDSEPEIAFFASGESTEGYVMYDFDTFASDIYANTPVFSRAYAFDGTLDELKEKINSLGKRYSDPSSSSVSGGVAEIKNDAYLYQVKPVEGTSEKSAKVALVVQTIPES
ncbi:MAG: hypothetical protein LBP74_03850 [Treponema sp.]|jgi:hypothetical protein|nr:hypothetical protein [Treponema sp.]